VSVHTDQCIRDAATFGFCIHTTLPLRADDPRPPIVLVPPLPRTPPASTRRRKAIREALRYVSVLALFGYALAIALTPSYNLFQMAALVVLPGVGYLLLFLVGWPAPFRAAASTDVSHLIPRNFHVNDDDSSWPSRTSQHKPTQKGPDAN
jgi:hypothetical protein